MKTTVVYHSADADGWFCRETARKYLPEAELIGWDYKDAKIPFPETGEVYVLDLSPECFEVLPADYQERLIWIDHHASAIAKWPVNLVGYRIDGVAACRLAYQWFTCLDGAPLPSKQNYKDRAVAEPFALMLAGEYDVWDHEPSGNKDKTFQLGLRSRELTADDWKLLMTRHDEAHGEYNLGMVNTTWMKLMQDGRIIEKYVNAGQEFTINTCGFIIEFEGLKFLALNTPNKSSTMFEARDVPETGHDALMKFNYDGKTWDVSLYHAAHRTDIDLSVIALKHGGGGHKGACGFRPSKLPFLP